MLRIHFTADDLARTTLAAEPHPLWEVLLSLHMLQTQADPVRYGAWRQRVRLQRPREAVSLLVTLAPPVGYSPDFLTPNTSAEFGAAVDQMLSTPRRQLRTDLSRLSVKGSAAGWIGELAAARPESLHRLGRAVQLYHGTALAPYWSSLTDVVRADHRARMRELSSNGMAAMLARIHPQARWRGQVLEISSFPGDSELHLDGRGLRLQPSYFCWKNPTKLMDDELPPVLVFPIRRPGGPLHSELAVKGTREQLSALLGPTRAAILESTAAADLTTTQVAGACNITMGTASHHTAVLRDAGLISSQRHGRSVIHRATKLGHDLLTGGDTCQTLTTPIKTTGSH